MIGHPIEGGRTTPIGGWGGFNHPMALGGGWTTPIPQLGWSGHPQWDGQLSLIYFFKIK
jgi:hypothetical protein